LVLPSSWRREPNAALDFMVLDPPRY
jgi:hypothetical protein